MQGGEGRKEGRELRRERKRERQEEELLGLGEVKVEGGEVVTAELVDDKEENENTGREERELSRTEQPAVTVTYIISAADQRTVVAKLTSEEEKKNFFAERNKETSTDKASSRTQAADFDSSLTTAITTPSSMTSTPTEPGQEIDERVRDAIASNKATPTAASPTTQLPSATITRLEGSLWRGGRRRGRSERFPILNLWRSANQDQDEDRANQEKHQEDPRQAEGRRSKRFPNRRPTVAPVVVDTRQNQETVNNKKSGDIQEMVGEVTTKKLDKTSTLQEVKQIFENKTADSFNDINKNSNQPVLLIKKKNTKEEVVMKKHVTEKEQELRNPKLLLGIKTQNLPKLEFAARQAKVVQITSALKKEMFRRKPKAKTQSILIKKVFTNSQISEEEAEMGSKEPTELAEKPPKPLKISSKANEMNRRPKQFEDPGKPQPTKPREFDLKEKSAAKKVKVEFGSRLQQKLPEPLIVVERATSRSAETNMKRPNFVSSLKPKKHNIKATSPISIDMNKMRERSRSRLRSEGHQESRRPKMLKTTTESPEAWLDRFPEA